MIVQLLFALGLTCVSPFANRAGFFVRSRGHQFTTPASLGEPIEANLQQNRLRSGVQHVCQRRSPRPRSPDHGMVGRPCHNWQTVPQLG
jgi:hypothetical protein